MLQTISSGKWKFVRPLEWDSLHTIEERDLKTSGFKFSHYNELFSFKGNKNKSE